MEIVVIDVKVSVRITDVKWLYTSIVQSSHISKLSVISLKQLQLEYVLLPVSNTSNRDKILYQESVS